MSFVSRSILAVTLLAAWPAAHACDVGSQKVEKVLGKKVATYNENGDFQKEIEASVVKIDVPLVECRDTPALVRVKTVSGDPGMGRPAGREDRRCDQGSDQVQIERRLA